MTLFDLLEDVPQATASQLSPLLVHADKRMIACLRVPVEIRAMLCQPTVEQALKVRRQLEQARVGLGRGGHLPRVLGVVGSPNDPDKRLPVLMDDIGYLDSQEFAGTRCHLPA